MTLWFIRGLRRGVVTTRYPARPDASAGFLPTPPAFRPRALTRVTAGRLVTDLPERGADAVDDRDARLRRRQVHRVRADAPPRRRDAVESSGEFELAATVTFRY